MSGILQGRHAVVTGGGRGIGAAVARALAELGATLTLMGRSEPALLREAERIGEQGGSVGTALCDVADPSSVRAAFETARARLGEATILVNNAGQAEGSAFARMEHALWERMLAVNLTGTFLCTREVLPGMVAAGTGRIVNIASTAGLKGYRGLAAYCAAKHGVVGMTRSLALEVARSGITVNAVCPGYTDTDMARAAVEAVMAERGASEEEARAAITRLNPQRRLVRPQEVAATVAWLCSPDAAAVTGQAIAVAGGEVM
jgi:NAD(P)-dependent dehydrogenase (short-subunit alcohol dehydrogenase family)